jgi:magnesium-transporting ATPase (P-type)
MIKIFRAAVILSYVLFVVYMVKPYVDTSFHDEETLKILSLNGYGAVISLSAWTDWIFLGIWFVLAVGMYLFNPIARLVYLLMVVIFTLLGPFFGIYVGTGTELALFQAIAYLDGAILTMAYLTSLSKKFKKA